MENKVNTKEDIIKHILENSEQLSALDVASLGLYQAGRSKK